MVFSPQYLDFGKWKVLVCTQNVDEHYNVFERTSPLHYIVFKIYYHLSYYEVEALSSQAYEMVLLSAFHSMLVVEFSWTSYVV